MKFNPNLHGLRGLAALAVFLFHWSALIPGATDLLHRRIGALELSLETPVGFGWLGVSVFFVLSGFLLASRLKEAHLDLPFVGAYLAHRALRIMPAYWVQLLVFVAVAGLGASWPGLPGNRGMLANFLLWIDLPPWMERPINGVCWTLPVEMMFYLLLPAVVLLTRAAGMRVVLVAALAVTLSWRHAVPILWPAPSQADNLTILNALPGSLSLFILGVAAAHAPRSASSGTRALWMVGGLAGLYLACALLLRNLATYWQGGVLLTVWTTLSGAAIAMLVFGLGSTVRPLPVLGSRPLLWLGDVSYGIYLWHMPVLLWLKASLPGDVASPLQALYILGLSTFASFLLAGLSFRWVEAPAIRLAARTYPLRAGAVQTG